MNYEFTLKQEIIDNLREKFTKNPQYRIAMNAASRNNLQEIVLNRDVVGSINRNFTYEIETPDVTDQAKANTCWLFANLNWLRTLTLKKLNVKQFEFSENHLMFYDKLEKANYFLQNFYDVRDRSLDDRDVAYLLDRPLAEGGEWHMTVNLIEKYGVMPKACMDDTFNRTTSRYINEILVNKLRESALKMFEMHANNATNDDYAAFQQEVLTQIYRILAIGFGVPPEKFTWSWRDEDKKYHQVVDMTPQEFYRKYVDLEVKEMYSFLSCPAKSTPFNRTFTVKYFNNMHNAHELHYLNVPIETLKSIAIEVLKDNQTCLFGCDVRYQSHTKDGIMDNDLLEYELFFDMPFSMTKGQRVDSLHVRLTHAMVLTGVELVDGKPVQWKVENSWGDKVGKKGFFIMSDSWFDEYTFDIIALKKYVPEELLPGFEQEPIVLPPWHPMG